MEPAFFVMKYQDYGSVYHREDCRLRDQMPVFFYRNNAFCGRKASVRETLHEKEDDCWRSCVSAQVYISVCRKI